MATPKEPQDTKEDTKKDDGEAVVILKQEVVGNGYLLVHVLIPSIDPVRPQIFALSPEIQARGGNARARSAN